MSQAVAKASLELTVAQSGLQLMDLSLSGVGITGVSYLARLCGSFQMIGWHTPENGRLASAECPACTWIYRGLSHTPKIV